VIRLVLFDIDGTLLVTGGAGVRAFGRVMATQFGIPNGTEGISFAGRTDTSIVREIFLKHHLDPSPENCQRFFEAYVFLLDHWLGQLPGGPLPGVTEWLDALAALPACPRLGLLTGNIRLGAEIKLRRFGLWERFETGGFGDDHLERNEIALAAQRRGEELLGRRLEGSEVLVVGDTPLDIACGRRLGAKVLAVATGGHALDELRRHRPDWAVPDLRRVSAREICGTPAGSGSGRSS
jgi:phosphoglycolate phosphatase